MVIDIDKDRETALSVINQWSDNICENSDQILEYVREHGWLRADIAKLRTYCKQNKLVKVAITASDVYGIDRSGVVYMTGRSNLDIPPNFS